MDQTQFVWTSGISLASAPRPAASSARSTGIEKEKKGRYREDISSCRMRTAMSRDKENRQGFIYFMAQQSLSVEQKLPVSIYTLFESDAEEKCIFYVGYSTRPETRYREHCGSVRFEKEDAFLSKLILAEQGADPKINAYDVKCRWIRFIKANGRTVQMEIVEEVAPGRNGWERERRWMFHCLQQGYPLANTEAKCVSMVSTLQRHPDLSVLREPFESPLWNPVVEAYERDKRKLNELLRKDLRFEP